MFKNFILFPNHYGQKLKGVANSPFILKDRLCKKYKNKHFSFYSLKNEININKNIFNLYYMNSQLNGKRMNIGGDHSMSIASCAYTLNYYKKSKILWFDAHADINSYERSSTKNIHGMPLHFLSQFYKNNEQFPFIKQKLNLNNLMYIGLRDIDDYEKEIIDMHKIKVIDSNSFNNDPEKCFHQIKNFLNDSYFHLSFDVDCLDPLIMPCTGTKVDNGLCKEQTQLVMKKLMKHKKLVNMDLTELNVSEENMSKEDIDKSLNNVMDIIF